MGLFFAIGIVVTIIVMAIVIGLASEYGPNAVGGGWIVVGIVICGVLWWIFGWMAFGTEETLQLKIVGKERIAEGNDGKWVVYVAPGNGIGDGHDYSRENGQMVGETFENTDALFHGKTRSTDLQNQLVVGRTYTCKVNGFRSGLLSSYRNILSCDGLKNG